MNDSTEWCMHYVVRFTAALTCPNTSNTMTLTCNPNRRICTLRMKANKQYGQFGVSCRPHLLLSEEILLWMVPNMMNHVGYHRHFECMHNYNSCECTYNTTHLATLMLMVLRQRPYHLWVFFGSSWGLLGVSVFVCKISGNHIPRKWIPSNTPWANGSDIVLSRPFKTIDLAESSSTPLHHCPFSIL